MVHIKKYTMPLYKIGYDIVVYQNSLSVLNEYITPYLPVNHGFDVEYLSTCLGVTFLEGGALGILIKCPQSSDNLTEMDMMATIAHESYHLACRIGELVGLKPSGKSEEAYAYIITEAFTHCMETYKEYVEKLAEYENKAHPLAKNVRTIINGYMDGSSILLEKLDEFNGNNLPDIEKSIQDLVDNLKSRNQVDNQDDLLQDNEVDNLENSSPDTEIIQNRTEENELESLYDESDKTKIKIIKRKKKHKRV